LSSLRPLLDAAELMDIDPRHALACRRRYLTERLWWASELMDKWEREPLTMTPEEFRAINDQGAWRKELAQIERMLRKENKGDISDSDIAAAREYPIDKVVEFHKGKALAWCHPDSTPSLTYMSKNKVAWCPVCNRYFDAISVLMERDGLNFPQAVKQLTNGG
jgi:hypothetical protein